MPVERRGQVIAIGSGQPGTGGTRSSMEGGSLHAMARAVSIERFTYGICERLGLKFPGPTRHWRNHFSYAMGRPASSTCRSNPASMIARYSVFSASAKTEKIGFFIAVEFIFGIRNCAGWRHDGKKTGSLRVGCECRFEVADVSLQFRLSNVADFAGNNGTRHGARIA
jgi:hypothetical protein